MTTHEQMLEIAERRGFVRWPETGMIERVRRVNPRSSGCKDQTPILAGSIDLVLGRIKWHRIRPQNDYKCVEISKKDDHLFFSMLTLRSRKLPDLNERMAKFLHEVILKSITEQVMES